MGKVRASSATRRAFRASGNVNEAVAVVVRIRPPSKLERKENERSAVTCTNQQVHVHFDKKSNEAASFTASCAFGPGTTQSELFERSGVKRLLRFAVEGYRATVFAYGQTGSGKTYTTIGDNILPHAEKEVLSPINSNNSSNSLPTSPIKTSKKGKKYNKKNNKKTSKKGTRDGAPMGLLPRSAKYLFALLDERQSEAKFTVDVSVIEIYNDEVHDLQQPMGKGVGYTTLPVRWHANKGFYVDGLKKKSCRCAEDVLKIISKTAKLRATSAHCQNLVSSRSHMILTYNITSRPRKGKEGLRKYGKISFIDLAGSERIKETGASGASLKEAAAINKSLYTLGQVISATVKNSRLERSEGAMRRRLREMHAGKLTTIKSIGDREKLRHNVPFRETALTKLLIDSIGGDSMTLMIACCKPTQRCAVESMRTLQFAMGVKMITSKPIQMLNPQEKLIHDLKNTIRNLKTENEKLRAGQQTFSFSNPSHFQNSMIGETTNNAEEANNINSTSEESPFPNMDRLTLDTHTHVHKSKHVPSHVVTGRKKVQKKKVPGYELKRPGDYFQGDNRSSLQNFLYEGEVRRQKKEKQQKRMRSLLKKRGKGKKYNFNDETSGSVSDALNLIESPTKGESGKSSVPRHSSPEMMPQFRFSAAAKAEKMKELGLNDGSSKHQQEKLFLPSTKKRDRATIKTNNNNSLRTNLESLVINNSAFAIGRNKLIGSAPSKTPSRNKTRLPKRSFSGNQEKKQQRAHENNIRAFASAHGLYGVQNPYSTSNNAATGNVMNPHGNTRVSYGEKIYKRASLPRKKKVSAGTHRKKMKRNHLLYQEELKRRMQKQGKKILEDFTNRNVQGFIF
eukprot:g1331.t1